MTTAAERKRAEAIAEKMDDAVRATGEINPKKKVELKVTLTLGQADFVVETMRKIAAGADVE